MILFSTQVEALPVGLVEQVFWADPLYELLSANASERLDRKRSTTNSWKYDQEQEKVQDNTVAEFGNQGQNNFILLLTYVGYWPGSYKEFLDDITPSNDTVPDFTTKIIEFNPTTLAGHPAYKAVYIYKALGLESDHETIWVQSLVGHNI